MPLADKMQPMSLSVGPEISAAAAGNDWTTNQVGHRILAAAVPDYCDLFVGVGDPRRSIPLYRYANVYGVRHDDD